MTWARLDDGVIDHPKILAVAPLAELLFYRAIVYVNRNGTNGFVPTGALPQLARGSMRRQAQQQADALVAVNLWHVRSGGWEVHDWEVYARPPRDAEERRAAGARGGKRSAEVRREKFGSAQPPRVEANPEASASANAEATPSKQTPKLAEPRPVPVPVVTVTPADDRHAGVSDTLASPNGGEALVLVSEVPDKRRDAAAAVERVFEAWAVMRRALLGRRTGRVVLTPAARKLIAATLVNYPEADCMDAFRGWRFDSWEERAQHTDLKDLLKPANLVRFRDWERAGGAPYGPSKEAIKRTRREAEMREALSGLGDVTEGMPPQALVPRGIGEPPE